MYQARAARGESEGGTGETGSRPGGLMQGPVLLQKMALQQSEKRQQTVLDGCGGDGREVAGLCCHDSWRRINYQIFIMQQISRN